jgi:hypothetical protein
VDTRDFHFRHNDLPLSSAGVALGEGFQRFTADILRKRYPDLQRYVSSGKDGCIDHSVTRAGRRIFIESKHVEDEAFESAVRAWNDVEQKLRKYLVTPDRPPTGQSQFAPWYETDPPLREFVFVTNARVSNESKRDELKKAIHACFNDLAKSHAHLRHLADVMVTTFFWDDLLGLLEVDATCLLRWSRHARNLGFAPLRDDDATGLRAYMTDKLPYYSRKEHIARMGGAASQDVPDENDLLQWLKDGEQSGLVITGPGGVGKSRLTRELGKLAEQSGWVVTRVNRNATAEQVTEFCSHLGTQPALFLFDYIETNSTFVDAVGAIEALSEQLGASLRFVACCRSSYYHRFDPDVEHRALAQLPQLQPPTFFV